MTGDEAAAAVVRTLEELGVAYMLVGSFSSNAYGIVRSTQDADFVVQLGDTTVAAIAGRLGPDFRLDPQMTFELVTGTTRFLFQLVDSPFKIEIFLLSDDSHDQERFRRRARVLTPQGDAVLPTAEDVIITKLRWSLAARRTKDQDDARNVIAVRGDNLDWEYIYHWCDQHGTRDLLDDIRRSIPAV